jgi:hypothetical protein
MKTRKVAGTPADATLPKTPITLDGVTYDLCFDLGALAEAEQALSRAGHACNLLYALPNLNLANVRVIFAAAIRKFHPEVSFEQAMGMITLQNVYLIANAVSEAWTAALPEPEPVPTEAVAE